MRSLILAGILLVIAGCKNVSGPLQPKTPARVDDPLLTIGEQERNGRANLAYPDQSKQIAPQSAGMTIPNNTTYGR
jgi:hypothetical protein